MSEPREVLARYGQVVPSKVNPDCLCVITPYKELETRLTEVRRQLHPWQVAFIGAYSETSRWGSAPFVWFREIVVGPGEDQWAIPRLAGTRCSTGYDLLETLRGYHRRFGIDITMADRDMLEFKLLSLPPDIPAFVEELYAFCPDPVDIGFTQAKEHWVEIIEEHSAVGLWWQGV